MGEFMKVTIYHNPRCSKSRQTLEILRDRNVDIKIIEYLNSPPTSHELQEMLQLLGMSPRELMRKNEEPYRSNNLNAPDITNDELIEFITKYPILIERPIVLANERAIIGRPPERVLEII